MSNNNTIITPSKARLNCVRTNGNKPYNWLFLPGGPGLGSESLKDLTAMLHLPGSMWHLDFPGDGSNIVNNDDDDFANWQQALIEAVKELQHVIVVAHSTGGMLALSTPLLEKNIRGLILMSSAPSAEWQTLFMEYVNSHPIAEFAALQKKYEACPSNEALKQLTLASAPYFSIANNKEKIMAMLNTLPFNYKSQRWAEKHFDSSYIAQWIPQAIPTLIFSGDQDHITPLKLFSNAHEFQRSNIVIQEIKNSSHFPWIDNPEEVKLAFLDYIKKTK